MKSTWNIAVLMGGTSAEREVSLRSGAAVMAALEHLGHRVQAVDPNGQDLLLPEAVDVVFLALHGTYGEDGQIQEQLERMGIAYTGSGPASSRLAFDKVAAKRRFMQCNLSTPPFHVISDPAALMPTDLGLPLVVKPADQGSSVGLHFIHQAEQWPPAIAQVIGLGSQALVERCVKGRELTVAILGDRAQPIVEIIPKDAAAYDYQHKYTVGATDYVCPANLDQNLTLRCQQLALEAFRVLGCEGYGRVDVLLDGDEPTLLEVNTLPGMTETSLLPMAAKASGMGFGELCHWMVQDAISRHPRGSATQSIKTLNPKT